VLSHALLRHAQRLGEFVRAHRAARAKLMHNAFARCPEPVFDDGYHDHFMLLLTRAFVNRAVGKRERARYSRHFSGRFRKCLFVKSQPMGAA
jgi:hypothetical protein